MQSKYQTVLLSEMVLGDAGSNLPHCETEVMVFTMEKREHSLQRLAETKPSSEEIGESEHGSYDMTERKRRSTAMANDIVTIQEAKMGYCCYCDLRRREGNQRTL